MRYSQDAEEEGEEEKKKKKTDPKAKTTDHVCTGG
jgi:hypothetical protein